MFTLPRLRGQGVAGKLITLAMEQARIFGLEHVTLSVDEANPAAIAAYTKLGFVEYGRETNFMKVSDGYVNEILMMKSLRE